MEDDFTSNDIKSTTKNTNPITTILEDVENISDGQKSTLVSETLLEVSQNLKSGVNESDIDDPLLINKTLNEISPLYLPKVYHLLPDNFTTENAPNSYLYNKENEAQCIEYIKNFNRQYKILYKDRKPLLLIPRNEYKVKKFVSTYLKPTKLPFRDIYTWESISSFVSDYLTFVPVLPTTEFPSRILSSTKLIEIKKGTSFEYSNLLCSLLLGVGYDAYVVIGYSTRECSLMDQSRQNCPFLEIPDEKICRNNIEEITKYIVKPAKDLKSKFELYQKARSIHEAEIEKKRLAMEKDLEERNKEKPKVDPLNGLRVHSWILVKAPLRDIFVDFFIEPLTGMYSELNDEMYTGIESIYNDQNCWINMQDCSNGIHDMEYDLNNLTKWEFVLPTTLSYQNAKIINLSSSDTLGFEGKIKLKSNKDLLNIIDCPTSWIKKISIKLKDYERRFPNNHKVTTYYKVKCERFSPYLNPNGLILKLVLYTDRSCEDIVEEQEYYSNKADKLYKIIKKNGWTMEYFNNGRKYQMKEHHYETKHPQAESNRIIIFNNLRVDGLFRREESQTSLIEFFENRSDNLIYLSCNFMERKAITFEDKPSPYRDIQKMTKRFQRNYSIPFKDDIQEIVFHVHEERIFITYHVDTFGLIPNTREFIKPQVTQDGRNTIPFHADTHHAFYANTVGQKEKSKLEIYQMLLQLIEEENKTKDLIRWSENETKNILHNRRKEKIHHVLEKSLYDTLRNEVIRAKRIELEEIDEAERNKCTEDELDYLAPFLAQLNLNDIEKREQAFTIREDCLQDFKLRLIEKANIIQSRFEDETVLLQKNQQWYQQNQVGLSKDDELFYLNSCNNSTFKINTLETMLAKHKQIAPHKYMSLERKIRNDPRMIPFFVDI